MSAHAAILTPKLLHIERPIVLKTHDTHPIAAFARLAAAVALGLVLSCTVVPASPAYAEVRTSDIVLGKTADERGIDATELPDIIATHAIVMTPDGTTYYERDADAPIKIASITKVMTALIALENCELTEVITVDHAAATVGESSVGLKEGDTLTMEEALVGLMVMSGNDTATAIAIHVGAKIDPSSSNPYQTFIDTMNARAKELGCVDTLFENPHGLDFGSWVGNMHSTTRDVMKIYAAAMQNEQFRAFDNSDRTTMEVTSADGTVRTINLTVRNKIRGQEGNIGGKTGSTYEAGTCFVGAFSREDDGEVYVAVFGSTDDATRFNDTLAVANWYYGHLATVPFANTQTMRGDAPVLARATCTDWTDKTALVTIEDSNASVKVFSLSGDIEQTVDLKDLGGTVQKGTDAGTITYTQAGEVVGEMKLVAAEEVAGTNPFEWVMVQFDRALRFFQGKPSVAESSVLNEVPDPLEFDSWNAAA